MAGKKDSERKRRRVQLDLLGSRENSVQPGEKKAASGDIHTRSSLPRGRGKGRDLYRRDELRGLFASVREEFGKGNEFCKKITYKAGEKPEKLITDFRNSYSPRIAVTVDMLSTGTDLRPLECLIFMRDVRSCVFFEQMKGRGTRTVSPIMDPRVRTLAVF